MFALKFHEEIARKKLAAPDGWLPCIFERVGPDAIRLDGAVPRLLQRGKRKGQPTWKGLKLQSVIVTDAEAKAAQAAYERETGACSQCQGEKRISWGWSVEEGTKWRDCPKCAGTGRAALTEEGDQ